MTSTAGAGILQFRTGGPSWQVGSQLEPTCEQLVSTHMALCTGTVQLTLFSPHSTLVTKISSACDVQCLASIFFKRWFKGLLAQEIFHALWHDPHYSCDIKNKVTHWNPSICPSSPSFINYSYTLQILYIFQTLKTWPCIKKGKELLLNRNV